MSVDTEEGDSTQDSMCIDVYLFYCSLYIRGKKEFALVRLLKRGIGLELHRKRVLLLSVDDVFRVFVHIDAR